MGSGATQSDTSISLLMEKNPELDKSWQFNLECQNSYAACDSHKGNCSISWRRERTVSFLQLLKDTEAQIRQTQESVWMDFQFIAPEDTQNANKLTT